MANITIQYRLLVSAVAACFGLMTVLPGIAHACMNDSSADAHDSHAMHDEQPVDHESTDSHESCCCHMNEALADFNYQRAGCSSSQTSHVVAVSDGLCCSTSVEQLRTEPLVPPPSKMLSVGEASFGPAPGLTGKVRPSILPKTPIDSRPGVYLICSAMRL